MSDRRTRLVAGTLALLGAAALVAGVVLHPSGTDPQVSAEAFAEYAATGRGAWVFAHTLQLAGVVAMLVTVVLLAGLRFGGGWTRVLTALAGASVAIAAVLQAVDGVALKATVDLWAGATGGERDALFAAALAVRQLEIGLDAALALVVGAAIAVFACASLAAGRTLVDRALAVVALAVGVASLVDAALLALGGYTAGAMLATTVSGGLAVVWVAALGVRALATRA